MVRAPPSLPLDFTAGPGAEERTEPPRALSVAELDRVIKRSLDASFESSVWVEGEVTGARPATSGHLYFALKDEREDASVDVAIYKTSLTPRTRGMISDGARVRLRGRPSFWAPRGRLQFVADRVELAGRGKLLEALERLKTKLAAEGLFDPRAKRAIPVEPRIIGVVTSKTGAVIHDICTVAFRRGGAHLLLAPALVQGTGAASSIRRAMVELARVRDVDVIIVGRGGGSNDDLSAFNDEELVRAVASSPVPVISAVGHEVDVTLTDFAADARAATPSQAAEMVVPDARARGEALAHCRRRLERAARARIHEGIRRLAVAERELGDPRLVLASSQQTLDDRVTRLDAAVRRPLAQARSQGTSLGRRLSRLHPSVRLASEARAVAELSARLAARMRALVGEHERKLGALAAGLDAMSPLRVLARGYAIATTEAGRAVRAADDVRVGESLELRLGRGRIDATVTHIRGVNDEPTARRGTDPR